MKSRIKYMILAALLLAAGGGILAAWKQNTTYMAKISFYVYSSPGLCNRYWSEYKQ